MISMEDLARIANYNRQCRNCHEVFEHEDDKYCTFCGTKRGEGHFNPFNNREYCIYGPMPVKRIRSCVRCGHQWTYCEMLDNQKFCVKCGGESKLIFGEED